MKKFMLITSCLMALMLLASPAAAKKKQAAEPEEPTEEVEAKCPEPTLVQENTLVGCRDNKDNDGDGHVDCKDQDCEIYAMCLRPQATAPAPPPVLLSSYTTMRQLKQALRSRTITPAQFHEQWGVLKQNRAQEMEQLRADYEAGQITRHEYRDEARQIRQKYEG
jgi:hypothetical protein